METTTSESTFLYFGFGSNLLAQRIHMNNPSAIRRGAGKIKVSVYSRGRGNSLHEVRIVVKPQSMANDGTGTVVHKAHQNYRLDFGFFSKLWNGAVATIVPDTNEEVWGAVWEIKVEDIPNLDRQEGVQNGVYRVVYVDVETLDGNRFRCRCYMLCELPSKISECEPIPDVRKPSLAYLNVLLKGAAESNLPAPYVDKLRKIQHNGWNSAVIQQIMIVEEGSVVSENIFKECN